jgi:hypothetical protein
VEKLSGVCQTCRRPVCLEPFCRKEVYKEDLSVSVIQCRNCASTA